MKFLYMFIMFLPVLLLAEHFPNMEAGAVAERNEKAGMNLELQDNSNNGIGLHNIHPEKFSFYFYEIKRLRTNGKKRPEPIQTIPRIKFYDNPQLKGTPAITIREDGLYESEVRKCGLHKATVLLSKGELKAYPSFLQKQFYSEQLLSLESLSSVEKCLGNKYSFDDKQKKCPDSFFMSCSPTLYPFPSKEYLRDEPYRYKATLIYAEDYKNGIAKLTDYPKTYYFKPSDYGLFSVQPPSHILVKQFFDEYKVLIPLRDKLLACAANKDFECILKIAPLDKRYRDNEKKLKEAVKSKEEREAIIKLVLKLNYKNGDPDIEIVEGKPNLYIKDGAYGLSLVNFKSRFSQKSIARIDLVRDP